MNTSSRLRLLADRHGVSPSYTDNAGSHVDVADETLVAVLAALDVDASTPESVEDALAARDLAEWRRLLPPCVVTVAGGDRWISVHVPHETPVEVWVETEDGEHIGLTQMNVWWDPREVDGRLVGRATFAVPPTLPLGWHTLHARGEETTAACPLVVTPLIPEPTRRLLDGPPLWGVSAQLYSVRSEASWGIGDLHDLADIATVAGREHGAGFIVVNPLHAGSPVPPVEPSPYLPATRRFFSPLYIRVEDIRECALLDKEDRKRVRKLAKRFEGCAADPRNLRRDPVLAAKTEALRLIFAVDPGISRRAAFDAFRESQGPGLRDFATWCALTADGGRKAEAALVAGPGSAEVSAYSEENAEEIRFHEWLQWILDGQLADAAAAAGTAGMPLGIVHDLAVGVIRDGADVWALGDVLASGVSVGAPADQYNQLGQDWSQPPWRPDRLAETGYAAFRDMLRTVLRHAGGLRVDHILGMFRLWWIPAGAQPTDGAYVRYDHEAMLGILALEAHRAGAVVIGEDLGTFEPWIQELLRARGLLGTSILWFERDHAGKPLDAAYYRRLCMASVTTHDLPPTAGYIEGAHVELRHVLGLLEHSLEEELAAHDRQLHDVYELLRRTGFLPADAAEPDTHDATLAMHRFVAASPAALVAVSLVDCVGDRRIQNQPGTSDEYPNWRIPLCDASGKPVAVEALVGNEMFAAVAEASSRPLYV